MKRYTGFALLTAMFVIIAVAVFGVQMDEGAGGLLSVDIASGDHVETIQCWTDGNGRTYVFLPSYAAGAQLTIHPNTAGPVEINGIPVTQGMSCAAFQMDTPYEITYKVWGETRHETITFLQSGGVASMYVNTESGSMDYIHAKKGNEEAGELRLYSVDGSYLYGGRLESVNGRGNNTWEEFEKKPYSITLAEEADLLGMGRARRWILLANAGDPSNLRNKLVYDFAKDAAMAYSPAVQWVDLYLNGAYAGLYQLSERNEVHAQRVDIPSDSFLVSLERKDRLEAQNYVHIVTEAQQALRVHYPVDASNEALDMLKNDWKSIENAVLADDGIDPATGRSWMEWIDLDSWVKKYLIEEVFGSGDACYISQFFYRSGKDGRIFAGPVWDFDNSLGNTVAWQFENPRTFLANRLRVKDGFDAPWFYALYQKEAFYSRLKELYQQEFLPLLSDYLGERMDQYAAVIEQAAGLNQIRWKLETDVSTEVRRIKLYMAERIDFLNSLWIDEKEYLRVRADHSFGGFYAYYAVAPGERLPELPVFEDTETQHFIGWYYVESGEPVDMVKPVWEDTKIIARWQEASAKKWDRLIKLIPLSVIALLGAGLLWTEIRRGGKGRVKRHG